jgi:hypothetical protein
VGELCCDGLRGIGHCGKIVSPAVLGEGRMFDQGSSQCVTYRTIFPWIAQETQYCSLRYILGTVYSGNTDASEISPRLYVSTYPSDPDCSRGTNEWLPTCNKLALCFLRKRKFRGRAGNLGLTLPYCGCCRRSQNGCQK